MILAADPLQSSQECQPATVAQNNFVTLNWLFWDPSRPRSGPRKINIPRPLFDGYLQDCRSVFAHELLEEFGFEALQRTITFYKPRKPLPSELTLQASWVESVGDINTYFEQIPYTRRFVRVLNAELDSENVHLVVTATCDQGAATRAEQLNDLLATWAHNRKRVSIPLLEELPTLLQRPFDDSEKIPITADMFDDLVSTELPNLCSRYHLNTLFKIGRPSTSMLSIILPAVIRSPPSQGTEYSFVTFWDENIRHIIQLLIPDGMSIRNSNHHTETRNLRPGYGFILGTICPFRGEEKGPGDDKDPRAELVDKLTEWAYNPASYMLGYYCRGSRMTLAAICPPDKLPGRARIADIITVDLSLRSNRIANIRHLINLSTLLPLLVNVVPPNICDYRVIDRENSRIEILNNHVIKTFKNCANARVKHLEGIYLLLENYSVPNTDLLVSAKEDFIILSPRGIPSHPPRIETELRDCLKCILDALVITHQIPLYHRDIRWENIVRLTQDGSKWILIDWEDASTRPTQALPSFAKNNHSPAVFRDGHGSEVDIWAIGHLITTSLAVDVSSELRAYGRQVCRESEGLSAQDVLSGIAACR